MKERGKRSPGLPYSAWELLEHMRIATHDILEFSRDAKHISPDWPSGYWPRSPTPPSAAAWDKSVKALEKALAGDGEAGDQSQDGPSGAHSPRVGPDDPSRSSADRRPQRLPLGTIYSGTPVARLLAGTLKQFARRCAFPHLMMGTLRAFREPCNEQGTSNRRIGSLQRSPGANLGCLSAMGILAGEPRSAG